MTPGHITSIGLMALATSEALASPRLAVRQGISSHSVGCSDACYSAIATYDSDSDPYAGNGMCYKWMSSYPPAHTTQTFTGTQYLATVSPTTFSTRTETVWQLSVSNSAPTARSAPSAPAAYPTAAGNVKRGFEVQRRQTTSDGPAATSTVAGLPLPNSNIASSCSNDPVAFASACSCIGDSAQTSAAYTTVTISSTSIADTITRECTRTITSEACAATASYGMVASPLQFGDTGHGGANSTVWSNSTTAADCCSACHTSDQNCRFFTYTAPDGSNDNMADGGSCSLNLEGDTCPNDVLPPNTFAYDYNYITEGMVEDVEAGSVMYGFGPCAQQVPSFYGYEHGRAGVGVCTADTATATLAS